MEILGDDLNLVLQGLRLLRSAQLTDIPDNLEYLYQRVKSEVVGEEEPSKEEPSKEENPSILENMGDVYYNPKDNPITGTYNEGFQTPFGYDPFISPNPFGGVMNEPTPF